MKFVDFENRVCLVTGAGSPTGIGFNTAKILGGLGRQDRHCCYNGSNL